MFASFIAFYTAYDKTAKKLKMSNVVDLFTISRGWDWTLVELNKALSLSAMSTVFIGLVPVSAVGLTPDETSDLIFLSMMQLWYHSLYSIYKFYGYELRRFMKEKTLKQFSVVLGTLGQFTLMVGYYGYISYHFFALTIIIFGIGHFWTMEVDHKFVLQVRPYAYLPFYLAGTAFFYHLMMALASAWHENQFLSKLRK